MDDHSICPNRFLLVFGFVLFFVGYICCRVLCSCEGDGQQGKKGEMKILFFFSIVVHKKERNDGLFIHHSDNRICDRSISVFLKIGNRTKGNNHKSNGLLFGVIETWDIMYSTFDT